MLRLPQLVSIATLGSKTGYGGFYPLGFKGAITGAPGSAANAANLPGGINGGVPATPPTSGATLLIEDGVFAVDGGIVDCRESSGLTGTQRSAKGKCCCPVVLAVKRGPCIGPAALTEQCSSQSNLVQVVTQCSEPHGSSNRPRTIGDAHLLHACSHSSQQAAPG